MNILMRFFLVLAAAQIATACGNTPQQKPCETLLADVATGEINSDLKISVPESINQFKIGEDVNVVADNYSKSQIEVAPDQDLQIYWWNSNSWVRVMNQGTYLGRVERLSFPSNDDPGGGMFDAIFTIPQAGPSNRTCIILRGLKDPDGSRIKVGATVEFVMHP